MRRAALEAVTRRLLESEVIDGSELRDIIEASTDAPQLVPGTDAEPRRVRSTLIEASEPDIVPTDLSGAS